MSWILAFLGFILLIVLHEFGHFIVAKKVGMRVERFMLFFPPILVKKRKGETEYGIGLLPFGGYVKITGMNPTEEIPEEVLDRAYYRQPTWKRIVVILAGPVMNLIIAFLIIFTLIEVQGIQEPSTRVATIAKGQPAAGVIHVGDEIVSVNGVSGDALKISKEINKDGCPGKKVSGCQGSKPLTVKITRDGKPITLSIVPEYDAKIGLMRIGFGYDSTTKSVGPLEASELTVQWMWDVTTGTVDRIVNVVFDEQKRKELHSVVGSYEVARQSIEFGPTQAFTVLALISLSLAIINLFPFLPLDGGHIFWALAEKVRGKPIPFSVMEKSGFVGFALVITLFLIGLNNDISQLSNGGIKVR